MLGFRFYVELSERYRDRGKHFNKPSILANPIQQTLNFGWRRGSRSTLNRFYLLGIDYNPITEHYVA